MGILPMPGSRAGRPWHEIFARQQRPSAERYQTCQHLNQNRTNGRRYTGLELPTLRNSITR